MKSCSNCFYGSDGLCVEDGIQSEPAADRVCDGWKTNDVYQINGYENREEYLNSLADEYDCPIETVHALAEMLGENEDFDGLVSSMKDYEEMRDYE